MKLERYLEARGETQADFARRTGMPQQTINTICQGRGTHAYSAYRIIKATGGKVRLIDLCGERETMAKAS